jgi:pimeloyl-ACP methyl ester carboxylesterase
MKNVTRVGAIGVAALSVVSLLYPASALASEGATLAKPFTQCRLTDPMQLRSIEAECAEVSVFETDAESGRRITLSVARIPAINRRKQIDPIVILAGGPGQGAQLSFTAASMVFSRTGRQRDILLLDQRGTGRSNILSCMTESRSASEAFAVDAATFIKLNENCLERLRSTSELGAYTTSRAVRDLDAVRALFGYETLNLYAASYGTRVAQHYARRYPSRVRSMVLDGVVAPQTVLGPGISLDAQAALDGIWMRCNADKQCRENFGDMQTKTKALQTQLKRSPPRVEIQNPRTGIIESFDFGAEQLAVVLRFGSYDQNFSAMLPLVVTEAVRGNFRPIGTLFLMTAGSVQEVIALGMHNSVVCSEDVPRFSAVSVDRAAVAATYLGTGFLDALPQVCRNWPRGLVDKDFFEPLVSDIPTLLLSGSLDPVTPPGDAERVTRSLKNSRHLVFEGSGHGQLGIPCMDRVLANFYGNADPKALDVRCLDQRMPPPFWISLAGPAP